uniref:UBC core domain-containing protein n=1 Tax=Dendroctonus ponderosae TaxID=77166 RepID=A0AAR5QIV0_DENPD
MSQEKVKEFYANDIVYRFDKSKKIIFGVVLDSYEASNDDTDDVNSLQKGQIRVSWSNTSREQIWRQSKVYLMNRSIIPGDIIRRLEKGKETQRGYCKSNKQIAAVQIVGTDKVIEHVSSDRLKNVRPFDVDDAVSCGDIFGRIESIDQLVTMRSIDGSVVELLTSMNNDFDDYWLSKRGGLLSMEVYYPGQEVVGVPANFVRPTWIKKTKTMKRNMQQRQRFTIQEVNDAMIEVALHSNISGYSHISEIMNEDIKKLQVLEHPSDTALELMDRRLLKLNSHDILLRKKDWVRKLSIMHRPEAIRVRHNLNCNSKNTIRVPRIRSSSLLFSPSPTKIDCDKPPVFPGVDDAEDDWWTEEGEESEEENTECGSNPSSKATSVVMPKPVPRKKHYPPRPCELTAGNTLAVEVVSVESKITVVWQDGTEEKDIPSTQLYYNISIDDHEFFPGEWVVKSSAGKDSFGDGKHGVIQRVDYMERTATVKWFQTSQAGKPPLFINSEELSVYDLKKHFKYIYRPGSIVKANPSVDGKIGKVIDSCIDGYVIVEWQQGKLENCWPESIELLPDRSDYAYSDSDESTADLVSWETESIQSYAGGDLSDETVLQNIAARLDFVRSRIVYLKDVFKTHTISDSLAILKDLLTVYENSSYLDKLLGTSFFSLKSSHFQALLMQAKEKAKAQNIELRGRLFSIENGVNVTKNKSAESENIKKMIKLENKVNAEIEKQGANKQLKDSTAPSTPESLDDSDTWQENLCVELLSTLKLRMDLTYAEIISRIGGSQALSIITKATESIATPLISTPLPSVPATPDESVSITNSLKIKNSTSSDKLMDVQLDKGAKWYISVEEAPVTHHYFTSKFEPGDTQKFLKSVVKEYALLKESLPADVWVCSYGNRLDLLSVMIRGPAKTPYEDGLFLFDIQLSADYPRSPPLVHYISYSSERLNPNLYVEGKVCVSLLGTWMGKGTEVWGPDSTLLQLIVSIQGLILVSEPYYNEAGYEKQTDSQQGYENSRTYNELVILKLVQSMTELLLNPPAVFHEQVLSHFAQNGEKLCQRLETFWRDQDPLKPDFPLLPVSKGLILSLSSAIKHFRDVLERKTSSKSSEANPVSSSEQKIEL